jgi:hypothetical protein
MATTLTRKKLLISSVALIAVVSIAALSFVYASDLFKEQADTIVIPESSKDAASSEADVAKLIEAGDEKSIQAAGEIIEAQMIVAEKSGDDRAILNAQLAKATLLIETSRAQEAIDSVLLPLEKRYAQSDTYKYEVYGQLSWAYRELGDIATADKYYSNIPAKGWN